MYISTVLLNTIDFFSCEFSGANILLPTFVLVTALPLPSPPPPPKKITLTLKNKKHETIGDETGIVICQSFRIGGRRNSLHRRTYPQRSAPQGCHQNFGLMHLLRCALWSLFIPKKVFRQAYFLHQSL